MEEFSSLYVQLNQLIDLKKNDCLARTGSQHSMDIIYFQLKTGMIELNVYENN